MRIDRFITLGLVGPLRRGDTAGKLPILMYHSISDETEAAVSPYYRTITSPVMFGRQMRCIARAGWKGVSMREGLRILRDKGECSGRVVITFDDAFADFELNALPILREAAFSATVYAPTSYISNRGESFKGRPCLTWQSLVRCRDAGIEFGSHTQTHPKLVECSLDQIEEELRGSKALLEEHLGCTVDAFAYPYAFPQADEAFRARIRGALVRSGYSSCVTTTMGRAEPSSDRMMLPRLPVNGDDDEALLLAKLTGAYDWMGFPQRIVKRVKATLAPRPLKAKPSFST